MLREHFDNELDFMQAVVKKYFTANKYVMNTDVTDDLIIQITVLEEGHKIYIPDTFRDYRVNVKLISDGEE